jgi:hypothetical protein
MDKREALKGAYKSKSWKTKVDQMSEDQVVAIYLRLKTQGKI